MIMKFNSNQLLLILLYVILTSIELGFCLGRFVDVESVSQTARLANNPSTFADCFGSMRDAKRAKYHLAIRKSTLKVKCVTLVSDQNVNLAKAKRPQLSKIKPILKKLDQTKPIIQKTLKPIKKNFLKPIIANQDLSSELDKMFENSFNNFNENEKLDNNDFFGSNNFESTKFVQKTTTTTTTFTPETVHEDSDDIESLSEEIEDDFEIDKDTEEPIETISVKKYKNSMNRLKGKKFVSKSFSMKKISEDSKTRISQNQQEMVISDDKLNQEEDLENFE
jgi:hypothetical protein